MNIHINDFEGPLDLLLHLVKNSKMDIYEIKISDIIEQYLNIINEMKYLNMDIASSYLVMSAELLHLKSKMLINQKDDEEEFEYQSEEDLRQRLIEYQMYKDITAEFRALSEKRSEVYTKVPSNIKEYKDEDIIQINNGSFNVDDLLKAILEVKFRKEMLKPVETKITKKELSVNEKIKSIRNILKTQNKINFLDLFDEFDKKHIVVTFLSILDMSKNKEIVLFQEDNFGNILIEKRG